MENKDVFLKIEHLEKVYPNGEKAVYDFNLDVYKNEFIVIVGPSGCGKTTTLRMVAGLEDITSGDIYMEDELINYKESKDRKMAIVFQSYALYSQMTVFDNIAFPLTINKYPYPKVNINLKTNNEILNLINTLDFKLILKIIKESYGKKVKNKDRIEHLAARFHISYEASVLFDKLMNKYSKESIEDLLNKESEIKSYLIESLNTNIEKENEVIAEKNIKLDEAFNELDENNNVIIEYRKMTDYEIKEKVFQTAKTLDLGPYLDKLPRELSGGQMQRVALGRAIVKNVPMFLMDEPLSNLDAKLRLTMRSEIVKLHNLINATTLYVTHDQTEAMSMASRIVVMSRGFIQQIGTPSEIYENPKNLFVAKFIGSPSINIFDAKYEDGHLVFDENFKLKVDDKFITNHDEFYKNKLEEFENISANFDEKASEYIQRVISSLSMGRKIKVKKPKENIFKKIKNLMKKKEETVIVSEEETICLEKLEALKKCNSETHDLIVAVRPEKIKIRKYEEGEKLAENETVLEVSVSELLGAKYNVHFTYKDKDIVSEFNKENYQVNNKDKFVLSLSFEDCYIFDPITGDRLK